MLFDFSVNVIHISSVVVNLPTMLSVLLLNSFKDISVSVVSEKSDGHCMKAK